MTDNETDGEGANLLPPGWRSRLAVWMAARSAKVDPEVEANLKPSQIRGTEGMYGYLIAAELVVVAILNLTMTHGVGAPKHPQTGLSVAGLAASVALVGLVRLGNRTVVGFGAIIAAYLVSLPKVPTSIRLYHLVALAFPVAYALILATRQRRATMAQVKSKRGSDDRSAPRPMRESRRDQKTPDRTRKVSATARGAGRGRRGDRSAQPTGPKASSRYTPPRAKGRRG